MNPGPTALSRSVLNLPAPAVRIVHLGLGAFHRAHQVWYTQHAADGAEWGITAFSMRSAAAADLLAAQDGLFTLVERGAADSFELLWPILEVGDASADAGALRMIELIAAPSTAVVTLTITEAGYVAGSVAVTLLRAGLAARAAAGAGPIAVVPCDNLSGNGDLLASLIFPAGRADGVSFISTSVDRITPRSTSADQERVLPATGREDAAPVVTEPYRSWILQGDFPAGRPRWEPAGAMFVADVTPWEQRKLWMLNGAHSYLANAGLVRGLETVAQAISDPELRAGVQALWAEVAAHLPAEVEAENYAAQLIERFENGRIEHRLSQIAADSVAKLRVRVPPVLRVEQMAGRSGAASRAVLEAWVRAMPSGRRSPDVHDAEIDIALKSSDSSTALLTLIDPDVVEETR
ncbi:D-mannonate oxidoreductase [Renibacterium salmoninarum ATCC 33209]|uniref:Mannitol-1-phosphate 5-dehydrogenase n=1 Tax=Renibacterium salmoninarum (strain ATCC 33209 / DSM 20767 / JCM 11484 / NBRC 15589 / NCIMB 2235) TaxID=288705 RepID=A9WVA8_RENSM|nr:mannitol dehydrogenase family protein [Renibacterium salmoninarum]ABY25129.1 D-mannonate oxidoreductase [Renibacterium salmoninarum ATCC 33209]